MTPRRFLLVTLVLALAASGCFLINEERDSTTLRRFLERTKVLSRQVTYVDSREGGSTVTITASQADDLSFRALVTVDGVQAYEQIIVDDALAVRIIDASKVAALQGGDLVGGSQVVTDALRAGKWVLDYQGAPPLVAERNADGQITVGTNPLLDLYYLFQFLDKAIESAGSVWRFDKDDITVYNARYEVFPIPEDPAVSRFDLLTRDLPRRSERGTQAALASAASFRRMAFYIRDSQVFAINEYTDIETHPDILRAQQGVGPKYPLEVLKRVKVGGTREPIVERELRIDFSSIGDDIVIELPLGEALAANLGELFGPRGLGLGTSESEAAGN